MLLTGLVTREGQWSWGKSSVADDLGPASQGQFQLEVTWKKPGLGKTAGPWGLGGPSSGNSDTHQGGNPVFCLLELVFRAEVGGGEARLQGAHQCRIQDAGNGGRPSEGWFNKTRSGAFTHS